jgi:uncharacterized membrane-anchored protein YhcB (DUF1043 family)
MSEDSEQVQQELACIIEKFPEYKLKVTHLYNSDEDFKTLCDDYCHCSDFLAKSTLKTTPAHKLLVEEYTRISTALEEEAVEYIQRQN